MTMKGGCYCGALRYESGDPLAKVQCSCRECQYFTSGSPNVVAGVPEDDFRYTKGEPKKISNRGGMKAHREFCAECGTHVLTRGEGLNGMAMLKVGTLDNPEAFGGPEMAVYTSEAYPWHAMPEGCMQFEKFPG